MRASAGMLGISKAEKMCIFLNLKYLLEALTGIYLGPDMEQDCLEIIALIIGGQNPNVKLYRGRRSSELFKVEFEQVHYTPYIVAKKLGLR